MTPPPNLPAGGNGPMWFGYSRECLLCGLRTDHHRCEGCGSNTRTIAPQPEKGKGGATVNCGCGWNGPLRATLQSCGVSFCCPQCYEPIDFQTQTLSPAPTAADAATHALTDEEIRIRIAEWCGYEVLKEVGSYRYRVPNEHAQGGWEYTNLLPAYTTSLDAIASAEARLGPEQQGHYFVLLSKVARDNHPDQYGFHVATTPARDRALALLRIINSKNFHEQ